MSFALASLLSENPPLPVSAVFGGGLAPCVVTFDQALRFATPLDAGNWFIRENNISRFISIVVSSGSTVTITNAVGAANPGPDVVSFSPPPFDVVGVNGLPAPAFTDFPLT